MQGQNAMMARPLHSACQSAASMYFFVSFGEQYFVNQNDDLDSLQEIGSQDLPVQADMACFLSI